MTENSAIEFVEENLEEEQLGLVRRTCSKDKVRKRMILVIMIIAVIIIIGRLVFVLIEKGSNNNPVVKDQYNQNETIQINDTHKNNETKESNFTQINNDTVKGNDDQKNKNIQQANQTQKKEEILPVSFVINELDKIVVTEKGITINDINISNVQNLTLNDTSMRHFDTSPFPNLKYLSIDENMGLLSLTINQSSIVQLSINSSNLLSLLLINNRNITTFTNSSLPNLRNLTVIKSNILKWQNYHFGKLQYLSFIENYIKQIPILDTGLKIFVLNKCISYQFRSFQLDFKNYTQLQIIDILQTRFLKKFNINNISVQRVRIKNSNDFISIQNCPQLVHLVIEEKVIWSLEIKDNPSIVSISIKAEQIKNIKLDDAVSFEKINMQVNTIKNVYLQGKQIDNIPFKSSQIKSLNYLFLNNTSIDQTQFQKIDTDNLYILQLESNSYLNEFNITFPKLTNLGLRKQIINFDKLKAPSLYRISILNLQQNDFQMTISNSFEKIKWVIFSGCKINILNITIIPSQIRITLLSSIINYLVPNSLQSFYMWFSDVTIINQTLPSSCYFKVMNSNLTLINNTILCSKNDSYFKANFWSKNTTNCTFSLSNNVLPHFTNFTAKYYSQIPILLMNNSFQLLKNLTITPASSFQNNSLPELTNFQYVSQSNIKSFQNVIKELKRWKQNGTNLSTLTMNLTEQEETQVKEIFQNIIIMKK